MKSPQVKGYCSLQPCSESHIKCSHNENSEDWVLNLGGYLLSYSGELLKAFRLTTWIHIYQAIQVKFWTSLKESRNPLLFTIATWRIKRFFKFLITYKKTKMSRIYELWARRKSSQALTQLSLPHSTWMLWKSNSERLFRQTVYWCRYTMRGVKITCASWRDGCIYCTSFQHLVVCRLQSVLNASWIQL